MHYLYSGMNFIDVWDAAKYCLNLLLSQDRSTHLSLFFQWMLEKLKIKVNMGNTLLYNMKNQE